MIGKSIKIKGQIQSSDPIYIYGRVEGSISAPGHRVTVGNEGTVKAGISAREVVIMGDVLGNVEGEYRVEIRGEGALTGDLATHRLFIEDGAVLRGKVDVSKPTEAQEPQAEAIQPALELGEATSAA
jgi:cytoskeletal protein CcmA (bactofilin family)